MFVTRGHLINLFIAGPISDLDIGHNVYQADNWNKYKKKRFQCSSRSCDYITQDGDMTRNSNF